jgi:hypothetical protein
VACCSYQVRRSIHELWESNIWSDRHSYHYKIRKSDCKIGFMKCGTTSIYSKGKNIGFSFISCITKKNCAQQDLSSSPAVNM